MNRTHLYCMMALIVAALFLPGCLIISESNTTDSCSSCYDYEVCETWCDPWQCWDECTWQTNCSNTCDAPYIPSTKQCYSDLDCGGDTICINDTCQRQDTNDRGVSGLCQACETRHDCVEADARCIRLNFDPVSNTGEKVCARDCDYNHDCATGFECVNISDEPGVPAQCLPIKGTNEKRTCNSGPDLQCVRANDCSLGESCVNNVCKGPENSECAANRPCAAGKECRNFKCEDSTSPQCLTRSDCQSSELCVDGACIGQNDSCVFNSECDNGACVNGKCVASCQATADCGPNEHCRQNLCESIECRRSADCSAGNLCVDAKCEKACANNNECSDGFLCQTGYCVADPGVACRSTAECARDAICLEGSCESPCSCNQDCSSGEICDILSGVCLEPEPVTGTPQPMACENSCGCPSGQACTEGFCG
ncbi:MAG: hypothetical protein H0U74_21495 [Bradymonadaceae bacterium]|nr:hypothetical protein [Lujinxingiaceae bacterium]